MPKSFDRCVNRGGRVRTLKPKGKKSRTFKKVCFDAQGSHAGETKKRKKKK